MNDLDPTGLRTLLAERVEEVRPDLASRAAVAVRLGTRTRHRRRTGMAAGAVGLMSVGAAAVPLVSHLGGSEPGIQVGTDPTSVPPAPVQSAPDPSPTAPAGQHLPVTFTGPGWTCDPAADEKFLCFKDDWSLQVTVRGAESHHDYLTNPDKASPDQYVSPVHNGVFATLEPQGKGVPSADDLAAYLVWE